VASKRHRQSYEIADPNPAALVESLRAFGYSLQTAVADLIDNSVTHKARNVWIQFEWKGSDSNISIKDDGAGMSEDMLREAMRPGSQGPLVPRDPDDLGRFGLGLKTASFSQCRRLTVVTRQMNQPIAARCWDLDCISELREWRLLIDIKPEPFSIINESMPEQGTIVIWQNLDRVVGHSRPEDRSAYKRFLEGIERVKQHLAMVFHRHLERPSVLKLWVNGRQVEPWDPFLRQQKATQELPTEVLSCAGSELTVIPYVLPHQSKISAETHRKAAGIHGWNAQQGFYVYRNERMLVAGEWLGLGIQKEEHYKLARIQIDLPNSMDAEWQIDVKKSRAKPPGPLRDDLKRIANLTRQRAAEIYRHRGKVLSRQHSQSFVFLWEQKARHGKFFYSINRTHPLVQQAYRAADTSSLTSLLSMLEESVPVAHIVVTNSESPDRFCLPYEHAPPQAVMDVLTTIYTALRNSGVEPLEAGRRLAGMDPFNLYPEHVKKFITSQEGNRNE
jgi:hypothetical protein